MYEISVQTRAQSIHKRKGWAHDRWETKICLLSICHLSLSLSLSFFSEERGACAWHVHWLRKQHIFKEYREGKGRRNCFCHQVSEAVCILLSREKLLKIDFYLWKQNGTRKRLDDLNKYNLFSILFAMYQDFTGGEIKNVIHWIKKEL